MPRTTTLQLPAWSEKFLRLLVSCHVPMVIVVLGMLVASQSALGSCGDYLYRNGRPVNPHFQAIDSTAEMTDQDLTAHSGLPEIPARRCSGPNCSSSPVPFAPAPNAPSNLIRGFDQAAILESLCQFSATRGAVEFPESERGACFEPSLIFRPPAI